LKAFAIFAEKHPHWRLAIMGDGPAKNELSKLASELRIEDRVDWLGIKPDPYPRLRGARIFAVASRHEGTPNALLEAMACGLPCIVSDASPGPLDLVEDDLSGLVVPVNDHAKLAQVMDRLADNAELCSRLGEKAKERVRAHTELALQSWESVIELVNSRQAGRHDCARERGRRIGGST
jgi:glycosyltransferase involved in cell wall biosynthesis